MTPSAFIKRWIERLPHEDRVEFAADLADVVSGLEVGKDDARGHERVRQQDQ